MPGGCTRLGPKRPHGPTRRLKTGSMIQVVVVLRSKVVAWLIQVQTTPLVVGEAASVCWVNSILRGHRLARLVSRQRNTSPQFRMMWMPGLKKR